MKVRTNLKAGAEYLKVVMENATISS